jgi:ribosome-binding protein aMBF1 (putative translation factor)
MTMSRSYDDASADRRARMSEAVKRHQARFEHAYDLAMQITELRERRGLTQADLANQTGIDQADISRIERGSANPTERTLTRIADALGAELRFVERSSA